MKKSSLIAIVNGITKELNAELAADLAEFEKSIEPAKQPPQPAK